MHEEDIGTGHLHYAGIDEELSTLERVEIPAEASLSSVPEAGRGGLNPMSAV
jgi:hypothetical protein